MVCHSGQFGSIIRVRLHYAFWIKGDRIRTPGGFIKTDNSKILMSTFWEI